MRHYHGTPLGGPRDAVARLCRYGRRHFLVPFGRDEDLPIIAQEAAGFCLDNGAFSAWRTGKPITDWTPYYAWVRAAARHPGFDFALIPDVIDGDERGNQLLIQEWERQFSKSPIEGVPVWHFHESLDRLHRLCNSHWRRVALGSSGEWSTPGTESWWLRMHEVMRVCCDEDGFPKVKLHGLRMLRRTIVERVPLASADSTSLAQNKSSINGKWRPPTDAQRMECLASWLESSTSPSAWTPFEHRQEMFAWCTGLDKEECA